MTVETTDRVNGNDTACQSISRLAATPNETAGKPHAPLQGRSQPPLSAVNAQRAPERTTCRSRALGDRGVLAHDLVISGGSVAVGAGAFVATSPGFGLEHPRGVSDALFAYGDIVPATDHPYTFK